MGPSLPQVFRKITGGPAGLMRILIAGICLLGTALSVLAEGEEPIRPPAALNQSPPRVHSLPPPQEFGAAEAVNRYLDLFTSPLYRPWLEGVWERSGPYRGHIRNQIEELDLPWELGFLPAVESAFRPRALSLSGAAGLWQFMMNSIGPYDMTVDSWRDDRRDFYLSTRAALEKLAYNYGILGDWYLALGAYNCGLGRMTRIIEAAGSRNFWELRAGGHLPRETAEYVPRLLAADHLFGYPREAGLPLTWEPAPRWVRIPLDQAVDLRILSESIDLPYRLLSEYNSELRYPITPPGDDNYQLKVPAQYADSVRKALEGADGLLKFYIHRIGSGDTFSALARHYGVSVAMIQQTNPTLNPTTLRIGEEVFIPALKDAAPYAGRETENVVFNHVYKVQAGDSLWSLSRRYGVSPEALAHNNGLDINGVLPAGAVIQVPRTDTRRLE